MLYGGYTAFEFLLPATNSKVKLIKEIGRHHVSLGSRNQITTERIQLKIGIILVEKAGMDSNLSICYTFQSIY